MYYNELGGYIARMDGTRNFIGFRNTRKNFALGAMASPSDAFVVCSMSSLYTTAESAETFAALILFVELIVLRHSANFLCMALALSVWPEVASHAIFLAQVPM